MYGTRCPFDLEVIRRVDFEDGRIPNLSPKDLQDAEQPCRALAGRYLVDAKKHSNARVRDSYVESTQKFTMLADRLNRTRQAAVQENAKS
jgi:hypothetical protein